MAVDVAAGPTFRAGKPKVVFRGNFDHGPDGMSNYDITPDGQRFVMVREVAPQAAAGQLVIVLHWFEELKRRVPTGK